MADLCLVERDATAANDASIKVEQLIFNGSKQLTPYYDSDGAVSWADDNRYIEEYQVVGIVSLADLEDLKLAHHMVMGATYVRITVYDKSASPYYNTYSPVQFPTLQVQRVTDDEWRVTCVFRW